MISEFFVFLIYFNQIKRNCSKNAYVTFSPVQSPIVSFIFSFHFLNRVYNWNDKFSLIIKGIKNKKDIIIIFSLRSYEIIKINVSQNFRGCGNNYFPDRYFKIIKEKILKIFEETTQFILIFVEIFSKNISPKI